MRTEYESSERRMLVGLSAVVVRLDFLAMPGLGVTEAQACQQWSMDAEMCTAVLDKLCAEGFLLRTNEGVFKRP